MLYMPLWTFEELMDAGCGLELELEDSLIEERFYYFGGTPRLCLEPASNTLQREKSAMEAEIRGITSFGHLQARLMRLPFSDPSSSSSSPPLFHFKPDIGEVGPGLTVPSQYQYMFCSRQVGFDVDKSITEASPQERLRRLIESRTMGFRGS